MEEPAATLRASIATLEGEVRGLELALAALAACVGARNQDINVATVLCAAAINAAVRNGAAAGNAVRNITETLRGLTGASSDPTTTLLVSALQVHDAGPARRAALSSWLAQATDEELLDEVRALLHRYGVDLPPAPDANG